MMLALAVRSRVSSFWLFALCFAYKSVLLRELSTTPAVTHSSDPRQDHHPSSSAVSGQPNWPVHSFPPGAGAAAREPPAGRCQSSRRPSAGTLSIMLQNAPAPGPWLRDSGVELASGAEFSGLTF